MISFLEKVRNSNTNITTFNKIKNSIMIFIFGIALGVFSKWLDNLSLNDSIWWQHILGILNLNNVFSSFGVWILLAICISIYSNSPLRASINVFIILVKSKYHIPIAKEHNIMAVIIDTLIINAIIPLPLAYQQTNAIKGEINVIPYHISM